MIRMVNADPLGPAAEDAAKLLVEIPSFSHFFLEDRKSGPFVIVLYS
jgi:hypothetical protein